MDTTTLASTVRDLSGVLAPFGGLALVAAFVWIVLRTGSAHILRRRVWQLLHGKTDVTDPDIRAFVDDRTSLMSFRFASGLRKVRTLAGARRLAAWLRSNDEDVSAVRRSGDFFDLESLTVREDRIPRSGVRGSLLIVGTAIAMFAIVPIYAMSLDGALLKVIKSGTWFIAYPKAARVLPWPLTTERENLTIETCAQDRQKTSQRTLFPIEDLAVACALLAASDSPQYVAKTVVAQRFALALLALTIGLLAGMPLLAFLRAESANQLVKRLKTKQTQLHLDL